MQRPFAVIFFFSRENYVKPSSNFNFSYGRESTLPSKFQFEGIFFGVTLRIDNPSLNHRYWAESWLREEEKMYLPCEDMNMEQ